MKRSGLLSYITLAIVFALFNVIAFVIPSDKTATFWTAYVFSVLAFVSQIPLWICTLGKKTSLNSKFLNIPLIHVGIAYLAIQLIAFTTFMLFPALPVWLAVVLCSIILALFALCAVVGRVGINEVNRAEDKIKTKRAFISFLQIDVDMLAQCEQDIETKTALKKLSENVRFSDPMSHEMLEELETKIAARVEELKTVTDKKTLINEIEILLSERNKKCKALK